MIILFNLHILQKILFHQFLQFHIHVLNEIYYNNENLALIQLIHNIKFYKIIANLLQLNFNRFWRVYKIIHIFK